MVPVAGEGGDAQEGKDTLLKKHESTKFICISASKKKKKNQKK